MSSNSIDISQVEKAFNNLNYSEIREVTYSSLFETAKQLQKDTQSNLIRKLGSGATSKDTYRPMVKGVRVKQDKDMNVVIVSLLKDYRLKWFELGTKVRKLLRSGAKDRERGRTSDRRILHRKDEHLKNGGTRYKAGANRGAIQPPLEFFSEARDNINETDILNNIQKGLDKLFNEN